jgi:thiol-disulfide isomerase/thioredoxin
MHRLPIYLASALALVLVLTGAAPGAGQDGIAVGATPEPVVLETLDGEAVDLAEVVGVKPVLVQFWATWCPICRALGPRLQAAHEEWGDRVEFLVVAVAVAQDQAGIRRHLDRYPVAGRVLWDTRGRATRAFDAPGTGFIVILDEDGAVAYTGTGTEQDISGAIRSMLRGDSKR